MGKTWLALLCTNAIASGDPIPEQPVARNPVLSLSLEDTDKNLTAQISLKG